MKLVRLQIRRVESQQTIFRGAAELKDQAKLLDWAWSTNLLNPLKQVTQALVKLVSANCVSFVVLKLKLKSEMVTVVNIEKSVTLLLFWCMSKERWFVFFVAQKCLPVIFKCNQFVGVCMWPKDTLETKMSRLCNLIISSLVFACDQKDTLRTKMSLLCNLKMWLHKSCLQVQRKWSSFLIRTFSFSHIWQVSAAVLGFTRRVNFRIIHTARWEPRPEQTVYLVQFSRSKTLLDCLR